MELIILIIIVFYVFAWIRKREDKESEFLRIIPKNDKDNVLIKLNKKKDEVYNDIQEVALDKNISIELYKSSSIDTQTWVAFSVKNSDSNNEYKSKDSNIFISILSLPFHTYDTYLNIELNTSNYHKRFENIIKFDKEDIEKILTIMTSSRGKIKYEPKRFTFSFILFWRPINEVIDQYREKNGIFTNLQSTFHSIFTLFNGRDPIYKITMGKPSYEPRSLIKLDSWQTVINSIGAEKDEIFNELKDKFDSLNIKGDNLKINKERIYYWGINGKEEREQLVCIFNRGYVFLHIYTYGDDLYIGWDAHLNYGTWEEYKVADGYTDGFIQNIELYSIRPTWKEVNEYDLDDTNFLLEIVHSNITQIVKRIMKEKKIDQEIDFSIVRESRTDALKAEKPKEDKKKSKFKRLS